MMKALYLLFLFFLLVFSDTIYAQNNSNDSNDVVRRRSAYLQATRFHGYELVRTQGLVNFWRDKESGIIFVDSTSRSSPYKTNIHIFDEKDGKIKEISPTHSRYAEFKARGEVFLRNKKEHDLRVARIRQEIGRAERVNSKSQGKPTRRRILGTAWGKLKTSKLGLRLTVAGGILYSILTSGAVKASEISDFALDTLTVHLQGDEVANSDVSLSDYLDNLKKSAEIVDANTPTFSADRQRFRAELYEIATGINTDDDLIRQEKDELLTRITEIRNIVQPPTPPRNPPRRHFSPRSSTNKGGIR